MRRWRRIVLAVLLCSLGIYPVSADHVATVTVRSYWGSTNQKGPSAEVVDANRGLIYKAFLGSRSLLVVKSSDLSVFRSWSLPPWAVGNGVAPRLALNASGNRLAVLHTTTSSAEVVIYNDAGAVMSSASFAYAGEQLGLAMGPASAVVLRAGSAPLIVDSTVRTLDTAPVVNGLAGITNAGQQTTAYFTPAGGETVNLVLLDTGTLGTRTTAFAGPATNSYFLDSAGDRLYIGSCSGLAEINRTDGSVLRTLDTATVGCLTDITVSPNGATLVAMLFSGAGTTAIAQVDVPTWTVARRVDVTGAFGNLTPLWAANKVFVTTFDYNTVERVFSGVLDLPAGGLTAIPFDVSTTDGVYGLSSSPTALRQFDPRSGVWRFAGYGGAVTKTIRAANGTLYAQSNGVVARIPAGANAPDVYYPGGTDMLLADTTLFTHDGAYIYAVDTQTGGVRTVARLEFYDFNADMAFDPDLNKLVVSWTRPPRNSLPQAGIAVVDVGSGSVEITVADNSPSIDMVLDAADHRVYFVTHRFGTDASLSPERALSRVELDAATRISIEIQGVNLSNTVPPTLAFDANRRLLAITDGSNLTAVDTEGRQVWTTAVGGHAISATASSWVVGGAGNLALVNPQNGSVAGQAQIGYEVSQTGLVNDLLYGFDGVSGAIVSAQPAAQGLVFQVEGLSLPPTSFETSGEFLVLGDGEGAVTLSSPHTGTGARGNLSTFFQRWVRADGPVVSGAAQRSWTWGPRPWAVQVEPYAEGLGGYRLVEYRDKTRMEITRPDADSREPWYVTNGLLVQEMLTGQVQTGDQRFEAQTCRAAPARTGCPSTTPIAGDLEGNDNAPAYADVGSLVPPVANAVGQTTGAIFVRVGTGPERQFTIGSRPELATDATRLVQFDAVTGHNIPAVFWTFMNQSGPVIENGRVITGQVVDPLFAFGRPITEPYWTRARVGGVDKDVLIQLFERRVLTYTPDNPAAFQVEMGNVGQHYYAWRYGEVRW